MKKILFVLDNYYPYVGGGEVLFKQLCEFLAKTDFDVTVLTTGIKGRPKYAEINGVKVISLCKSRYLFTFFAIFKAYKLAKGCDFIHTATYGSAMAAWVAGKIRKIKTILTVHEVLGGIWFKNMNKVTAFLHYIFEKFILSLPFDRYVAVSDFTKGQLVDFDIPEGKIERIYNSISANFGEISAQPSLFDTDVILSSPCPAQRWSKDALHPGSAERLGLTKKSLGFKKDDFVFLFFGRPGVSKGTDILIKAFRKTNNSHAKLLMILSREPLAEYKKTVIQAANDGRIKIINSVGRNELPAYISICDCVTVPSLQEGFGFSALESCCLGKPVVVSRTGALPEVVFGKVIFAQPGDVNSLYEGLQDAILGNFTNINPKHFEEAGMFREYAKLYKNMLYL